MTISLEQFTEDFVQIGLMSQRRLSHYRDGLPPQRRPGDAEALARELVRDKILTKYQAATILAGEAASLELGEYLLLQKIGEGGMGRVFKALHRRLDRPAAIKVLPAKSLDSVEAVKRFHQEVKVAARLNHGNIVATYDAGEQHGVYYLAMEYVEGRDLAALLNSGGPLAVSHALDYVLQVASGLEHAHGQGVVHRDIKPSNLLLNREGTVKILDMGLARIVQKDDADIDATVAQRLTKRGQVLGTIDYMSPEQATDTRSADHRADIYSLGCTLYSLLTGKPLYAGDSEVVKLMAHCEAEIPSLGEMRGEASEQLDRAFAKMVAKKPQDRHQSMTEVIADLRACLDEDRPTGSSPGQQAPVATPAVETHTPPTRTMDGARDFRSPKTDGVGAGSTVTASTLRLQAKKTIAAAEPTVTIEDRRHVSTGHGRLLWLLGIGAAGVLAVLGLLVIWVNWTR